MLPDIHLDDETFDEILEKAKNRIVSMYPDWTDFNYHDPGVTMLELFAWHKETQQYYLNKIAPANRQKYLKLMGIAPRHKVAARADVTLLYDSDILVAPGTRFYAGDLPFEAEKRTYIPAARIICCIAESQGEATVLGQREFSFGGNLRLKPFRSKAPGEDTFFLGFDAPLPIGEDCECRFTMNESGIPRNPVAPEDTFLPLVDMSVEYHDGVRWRKADIVEDTTYAFLLSGRMTIRVDGAMAKTKRRGTEAYFLRFRIAEGIYDTLPSIESILWNYVTLRQLDTRAMAADFSPADSYTQIHALALSGRTRIFVRGADGLFTEATQFTRLIDPESGAVTISGIDIEGDLVRIVSLREDFYGDGSFGYGSGLPYQEYDLETEAIDYTSFSLMTELPGTSGRYAEWTLVPDFARSGPADLHYVLDPAKGRLIFGDCEHGCAPEGTILITGCALSAGANGNVAKHKITRLDSFDSDTVTITNMHPAYGGKNEETMDDCLSRAHEWLRTTETMVSAEDCEARVRMTPGLRIEKCQVVNMSTGVSAKRDAPTVTSIVVKPYAENGRGVPSPRYVENILRYTDRYRLLGTRLSIVSPEYADVTVFADIDVSFGSTNARERVTNAIHAYFDSLKDHFGIRISYSDLYAQLQRLDCVVSIATLTVDASGSDVTRTREGDLLLGPNVCATLAHTECILNTVY